MADKPVLGRLEQVTNVRDYWAGEAQHSQSALPWGCGNGGDGVFQVQNFAPLKTRSKNMSAGVPTRHA